MARHLRICRSGVGLAMTLGVLGCSSSERQSGGSASEQAGTSGRAAEVGFDVSGATRGGASSVQSGSSHSSVGGEGDPKSDHASSTSSSSGGVTATSSAPSGGTSSAGDATGGGTSSAGDATGGSTGGSTGDATGGSTGGSTSGSTAVTATVAPVGLCQAEMGAPPSCRSFVGAKGYRFEEVRFYSMMREVGGHSVNGQAIRGDRDILEWSDGSVLSVNYSDAVQSVDSGGVLSSFGSGYEKPEGLLLTLENRILVTTQGGVLSFARSGSVAPTGFTSAVVSSATQLNNGEIWMPSPKANKVYRMLSDGTPLSDFTHEALASNSGGNGPRAVANLADGSIVIVSSTQPIFAGTQVCKLLFLNADRTIREFAEAPLGTELNNDGSLTPASLRGCSDLLQLPNSQLLLSSSFDGKLVRLNSDGSVADEFTFASMTAPSGMTLDHRGRLLVSDASDRLVHLLVFPGCANDAQDGDETDQDCGGSCSTKCKVGRSCKAAEDCVSLRCESLVCKDAL